MRIMKCFVLAGLMVLGTSAQAQVMKSADLEKYAKEKYGEPEVERGSFTSFPDGK